MNTTARSRNFHFSSQRPHPIRSIGKFQRTIFVWLDAKLGTEDRSPQRESRNCWLRPSHPVLSNTLWIDFPPPTAPAFPREATVRQFAGAYCQTIVSSGGFRLTAANNSGHVSPAVHPSSPDVAVKRVISSLKPCASSAPSMKLGYAVRLQAHFTCGLILAESRVLYPFSLSR